MNKQENLKSMLKNRIRDLDKALMNFEASKHVSYTAFDTYLDEHYKPCTVGEYAFMPSKVMWLNTDAYFEMFKTWANSLDYDDIPEYAQLQDERSQVLDWLEELS